MPLSRIVKDRVAAQAARPEKEAPAVEKKVAEKVPPALETKAIETEALVEAAATGTVGPVAGHVAIVIAKINN